MVSLNTNSTLHEQYQEPLYDWLGNRVRQGLSQGLPQFPGYEGLGDVYDPKITQQLFQDAFVAPTLRGLTGPGGAIPREGARQAQRSTYFSSGRGQNEARIASGAFGNLANTYAGLVGQDQSAIYNEWQRTQPTGQITRQALNFLGTPMTVTQEAPPNPWMGALSGGMQGAGTGAAVGGGWGALIGGVLGAGSGYMASDS